MTQPTQISQEEINAILWKACDTFRGTIDPSEYKNYILVMLFVKYISDVWQDHYDALKQQHGADEELIRFKLRHERFVLPPGCRFLKLDYPDMEIRRMETRWGSCTPDGKILLNLKLMQVPKRYLDYVIVHELCHLKEHHHGANFYRLLDRVMPDWETRRAELNAMEVA